jgi:hypothetical protein
MTRSVCIEVVRGSLEETASERRGPVDNDNYLFSPEQG